jgi:hypothetical protein
MILCLALAAAQWLEAFNSYKEVYKRLGIDLPRSFENIGSASQYLDQVRREPCDGVAFLGLASLMESAGYPRESATSIETYNRNCSFSEEMSQLAYAAYLRIGDNRAAINVASELINFDPASYDYRFMRGNAYEQSKNLQEGHNQPFCLLLPNEIQLSHGRLSPIEVADALAAAKL